MLKTNSKQAKENIKLYIIERFDCSGYEVENEPTTFDEIATFILNTFKNEMVKFDKRKLTEKEYFFEWCQGLPSVLDTCYYYNRSAVDDLAMILEENETEKSKYTEQDAEQLLTHLIYRELKRGLKE